MTNVSTDTITVAEAGLAAGGPTSKALALRANILAMTEETFRAALTPQAPGGLSHGLRAALAARIARIHANEGLAGRFASMAAGFEPASVMDPAAAAPEDPRLAAILAFTDLVTGHPRDSRAEDVAALQAAGVSDADIVRLAELNAFLAYQIRLIDGLRLMEAAG